MTDDALDAEDPALHVAIGRLLGDARQAAGLPQSAAAKALGIAQSRIARLELGRRRLLFTEAVHLARLYGVKVSAFDPRGRAAAEITPIGTRRKRVDSPDRLPR